MKRKQPTPLNYSNTFPSSPEEMEELSTHSIETHRGWYKLSIDLETDDFILITLKGHEIKDNLNEIHQRKELYQFYERGMIYDWLKMIEQKLDSARKVYGETRTWWKIDGHKYMMRVNTTTEEVLLTMPKHTRVFKAKSMYIDFIDIPAIQEGLLNSSLRRKFKHFKFDIPESPYEVGLRVEEKNN